MSNEIDADKRDCSLTPLDPVHTLRKALLVHLSLFQLLLLDVFAVFLQITLFLGGFGFLDTGAKSQMSVKFTERES